MRSTLVFVALPFASAIALGPTAERAAATLDPTLSGPPPNPKDDGPPYNPKDDGPRQNSTSSSGGSLRVSILADTNRDGKVDVTGDTDTVGKETWTADVGALFLANIVDTDRRCSSQITGSCASELSDIFNKTAPPETPVLDPRLPDLPTDDTVNDQWYNSLDESQRNLFLDYLVQEVNYGKLSEVDKKISACNDASDDILRNATYLAPLRTRPIPGLSDSATGTITVTRKLAASKVRLFYKPVTDAQWMFITSNHTFKAQELKAGLELGIDARDIRRPGGWDGRATVEFKVKDGAQEAQDSVALRVAPILTQHHGQAAKQLLTSQFDKEGGRDPANARFVKELGEISSSLGLESPMYAFEGCDEIWTQDFFEPGYMSIPGPDGPVSMHIIIRSAQDYRQAGRKVFQDLRSSTVGAVQQLAPGDTVDSTGNLETVPPYSHNGKSYPAGRVVMGTQSKKPYMMAFLEAQETQDPIELDTSWLDVGHIDEFLQFLPANNTLGWVLMADDPLAGLEILQKAQQAGHGKKKAVSRPRSPADPKEWQVMDTIDELLEWRGFAKVQNLSATRIAGNIEILKRETGLTDADIIRQPCLYHLKQDPWWATSWTYAASEAPASNDTRPAGSRRAARAPATVRGGVLNALVAGTSPGTLQQGGRQPPAGDRAAEVRKLEGRQSPGLPERADFWAIALYPGTINSVVIGRQIIAPNPWGPIIDGQDVLKAATDAAYAKAGYSVRYVDDWFSHHKVMGDVHCGSNVIRQLPADKWW